MTARGLRQLVEDCRARLVAQIAADKLAHEALVTEAHQVCERLVKARLALDALAAVGEARERGDDRL